MNGNRPVYISGACEIDLHLRELRMRGSPVPLGGRAFEILEVLRQQAGELVTKDELLDRVWGGTAVSENLLQVHISAVRKALGPHRSLLKTHSGRGYRLLGNWTIAPPDYSRSPMASDSTLREVTEGENNFPVLVTGVIGRETALQHLSGLLSAYRIVTLVGAGGIGKTTLALHAARQLLPEYDDGIRLVEFASLSDPKLVPSTVASALGLKLRDANSTELLARFIGTSKILLLLDNCEHLIDAVATLAEALVRQCPRLTILATSREVLRIGGEYVYRVPPLEVPESDQSEYSRLRAHSAVALFIARAEALGSTVSPLDNNLSAIASICRRLDGMPLAIEFAAARAATLGIGPVHVELHNRFALLTTARRTAIPRHRTLRATLDWSYQLLPEEERRLLRRLSVVSGSFGLAVAQALTADLGSNGPATAEAISNLIDKSLIIPDRNEAGRWRLLETTRAYCAEKLSECGEAERTARSHAQFYLDFFRPFGIESRLQGAIDELSFYRREIDNLRDALSWAFSDAGDSTIGISLAADSYNFWMAESLIAECSEWCGKALARLGDAEGSRHEMVLRCARGRTLLYTRGMTDEAMVALKRGLQLAEDIDDADFQQRATIDLWLFLARSSRLDDALDIARRYEDTTRGREVQFRAVADLIVGISLSYLADHQEAAHKLKGASDLYPIELRRKDLIRIGTDLRSSAEGHNTVNLVSLGQLESASQAAIRAVEAARTVGHATVCIAFVMAGFTFLSLGELAEAEQFGEELIEHAYKHGLNPYHAAGLCIRGSVLAKRGEPASALAPLRMGLAGMRQTGYLLFHPFFHNELAQALAMNGLTEEALIEVNEALEMAKGMNCRWLIPEIKRAKGEILISLSIDNLNEAEELFHESLAQAELQGADYWEFCASVSIAEVRMKRGRVADARALLLSQHARFSETIATPIIKRAEELLLKLG